MFNDEFGAEGGNFLADSTGVRIRMLAEWEGALPDFAKQPDMIAALVEGTASDIQAALPALSRTSLTRLLELEAAGKNRVTVLESIQSMLANQE